MSHSFPTQPIILTVLLDSSRHLWSQGYPFVLSDRVHAYFDGMRFVSKHDDANFYAGCPSVVGCIAYDLLLHCLGLGGGGLMSTVLIIIAVYDNLRCFPEIIKRHLPNRSTCQISRNCHVHIRISLGCGALYVKPLAENLGYSFLLNYHHFTLYRNTFLPTVLGGALVDRLNWRWAFWVTPIFATPALVVVTFFFNLKHQRSSTMEKLKRVDFSGTFLEVIGITCLMLGINWGGTKYDWNSAPIISLLIISFILLSAFIYVEGYRAVEPIIPFRLFKKATIVASFVSNFFVGMNFFALLYFFPWLAEIAYGADATQAGIRLIPLMVTMVIMSIVPGIMVSKVGRVNQYIVVGNILGVIGFSLLYTLDEYSNLGTQVGYLIISGAGNVDDVTAIETVHAFTLPLGIGLAQMTILAVQGSFLVKFGRPNYEVNVREASFPRADIRILTLLAFSFAVFLMSDVATATALCQFMNTMGGSVGLIMFSSLYSNKLIAHIRELPQSTIVSNTWFKPRHH
ncbi:hypothetical protein BC936DRAFT_144377 [Jimgerdemannia flammicorona]|uniref:Major facilitator superfamily domain-containing protein n=1 Tax=Jimgerdemannia flammicorona TaxID=994334 RepID=A0A433DCM4_9FUNG|nr:hypothetical protein BC936DRAFT_144377 [Jimgerdemannia flammicorona]